MSYKDLKVAFFCVGDGSKTLEGFGANPWSLLANEVSQAIMLSLTDGPLTTSEIRAKSYFKEEELQKKLINLKKIQAYTASG